MNWIKSRKATGKTHRNSFNIFIINRNKIAQKNNFSFKVFCIEEILKKKNYFLCCANSAQLSAYRYCVFIVNCDPVFACWVHSKKNILKFNHVDIHVVF